MKIKTMESVFKFGIFFLISQFCFATGQLVNGRVLFSSLIQPVSEPTCTEIGNGPLGCSSDCKSINFCLNGASVDINCKEQNSAKPFCDKNTKVCTSVDTACADVSPTTTFKCPSNEESFFPDPLNCQKFYKCTNSQPTPMQCWDNSIFNAKDIACQTGITCYNFSPLNGLCRARIGQFVLHPLNRRLYVYCLDKPILLQCPNKVTIFNPTTKKCQFDCKKVGVFPDPADDKKWYKCKLSGQTYVVEEGTCESNEIFHEGLGMCIQTGNSDPEPTTEIDPNPFP